MKYIKTDIDYYRIRRDFEKYLESNLLDTLIERIWTKTYYNGPGSIFAAIANTIAGDKIENEYKD